MTFEEKKARDLKLFKKLDFMGTLYSKIAKKAIYLISSNKDEYNYNVNNLDEEYTNSIFARCLSHVVMWLALNTFIGILQLITPLSLPAIFTIINSISAIFLFILKRRN